MHFSAVFVFLLFSLFFNFSKQKCFHLVFAHNNNTDMTNLHTPLYIRIDAH